MNYEIIKTKLKLHGTTNIAELRLVIIQLVEQLERQEERINEQENRINALTAGSSRGARKNSKTAEVRPDEDE